MPMISQLTTNVE